MDKLPAELILRISSLADPIALIALSRTSHRLRAVLATHSSNHIWIAAARSALVSSAQNQPRRSKRAAPADPPPTNPTELLLSAIASRSRTAAALVALSPSGQTALQDAAAPAIAAAAEPHDNQEPATGNALVWAACEGFVPPPLCPSESIDCSTKPCRHSGAWLTPFICSARRSEDASADTPLIVAARNGLDQVCAMIVRTLVSADPVNLKRSNQLTMTHHAQPDPQSRLSVDSRADKLIIDNNFNKKGIPELTIQTTKNVFSAHEIINATNRIGETALHVAAENGYASIISTILSSGIASTDIRSRSGSTPLMLAALSAHPDACAVLLSHGASPLARDAANPGWTPLHLAARSDSPNAAATVRLLLDHGAPPDALDRVGETPLFVASLHGNTHIVRILVSSHASVGISNRHGLKPLHVAAARGHVDICRILIDAGAHKSLPPIRSSASSLCDWVEHVVGCSNLAKYLQSIGCS